MKIKYVPGKYLYMADTSSRAYLPDTPTDKTDDDLVKVVHFLITNLPVTTTELQEIELDTDADKTLQKVKLYCQTTWPRCQNNVIFSVRPYWNIRNTYTRLMELFLVTNALQHHSHCDLKFSV